MSNNNPHVRTRIAPSPTGEDLHIGNVYTGLINFAYAKKNNGEFIIRIEDTDRQRFLLGSEEKILASLQAFGLAYDEGPDIGGPYAPYRQSQRLETYHKYGEQLLTAGHAEFAYYPKEGAGEKKDYTNKGTKEIATKEPIGSKPKTIKEMVERGNWVLRMKIPQDKEIIFKDEIRGEIQFSSNDISPQVLIKSDGYPTYHLAVVVDDHLMKITHVIRAEEWISSTPKHVLLYRAFGWELPVFVHVPILRNTDKSKLSKRKNPVWISWFLQEGFLPEAILNFLALLGWSHPEEKEIFPLAEFISLFELKDIKPVGPVFDIQKLEWMNGAYIHEMETASLAKRLLMYDPTLNEVSSDMFLQFVTLAKTRMKTLKEFKVLAEPFLVTKNISRSGQEAALAVLLKENLSVVENWESEAILAVIKNILTEKNVNFKAIYMVFIGTDKGLPISETLEIIGKEKSLNMLS